MKAQLWGFALLVASLDANAASADPWALAPALPTACYIEQDKFPEKAYAQIEKIQAALDRQREINRGIQARLNAVEPMEIQQRMMEYLSMHPEEAQQVMGAMQSQGQAYTQSGLAAADEEIRQKKALDALVARYNAALEAAVRPHYDKIKALPLCDGECQSPQWAIDKAIAEFKLVNQEYEKLCGQWWAAGPIQAWFAAYRTLLVGKIPQEEALAARTRATNAMLGVTGDYRSESPFQEAEEYTRLAVKIFDNRWAKPSDLSNVWRGL